MMWRAKGVASLLRQAVRKCGAAGVSSGGSGGGVPGTRAAAAQVAAHKAATSSSAAGSVWRAEVVPADMAAARRLSLPLGALAGVFGSVAGSGGAAVIAPLLAKASRSIPQRVVAGTSLAAVLATALTSTATFTASGCLDPPASLLICVPAVAAAPLGARLASRLDCAALKRLLGYFLLAAAPLIPLKSWLFAQRRQEKAQQERALEGRRAGAAGAGAAEPTGSALPTAASPGGVAGGAAGWMQQLRRQAPEPLTTFGLMATGAAAGFSSGLLGIGGGTVATPMVALLMPYSQATVLGTTLLAMIPPTTVALLQHHRLGNVHWRLAAVLSAGAVVGAAAGSAGAVHSPPGVLEGCFTVAMLLLARMTLRPVG